MMCVELELDSSPFITGSNRSLLQMHDMHIHVLACVIINMHAMALQVRRWQLRQQKQAEQDGYVCTLLGRQRQLPDAGKKGPGTGAAKGHALRAAINTPVQGSAADVATAAMISINNCQKLKELGWKLLLQVRTVHTIHKGYLWHWLCCSVEPSAML